MLHVARRIWAFLHTPLFGTIAITKETRVDPALFSEDEFPIACKACTYPLRDLPDSICPECGLAFDRGRRLVEQYIGESWNAAKSGTRLAGVAYVIHRTTIVLTIVVAVAGLAAFALDWFAPAATQTTFWQQALTPVGPQSTPSIVGVFLVLIALLYVLFGVSAVLNLTYGRKQRNRRKRIYSALRKQREASAPGATSGEATAAGGNRRRDVE